MTLIKGEENVSFVSDRECDQRLEELKTGMSKAFDYNLGNDEIKKLYCQSAISVQCNQGDRRNKHWWKTAEDRTIHTLQKGNCLPLQGYSKGQKLKKNMQHSLSLCYQVFVRPVIKSLLIWTILQSMGSPILGQ